MSASSSKRVKAQSFCDDNFFYFTYEWKLIIALRLALKRRQTRTRIWPILIFRSQSFSFHTPIPKPPAICHVRRDVFSKYLSVSTADVYGKGSRFFPPPTGCQFKKQLHPNFHVSNKFISSLLQLFGFLQIKGTRLAYNFFGPSYFLYCNKTVCP